MTDIFSLLPDIIVYIVLGYIFLRVFRIVRIVKNSDDYEHIIVESLVFGFIIKNIAILIPFSLGYYIDVIGLSVSSAIAGYLFAKLLSNQVILNLAIDKLGIKQTRYKYMWQNIDDPDTAIFVDLTNPDTNIRYYGQLVLFEDFERFPIIQISNYINWKDDTVLNDYSKDSTRTVLIDTSQFSEIDIIYQNDSKVIKRWKN